MTLAYLDCQSGIAGDMMLAALIDAGAELQQVQAGIASLGLPGVRIAVDEVRRKGFRGLKVQIDHEPEHKHRHLHQIVDMISAGQLADGAKELAIRIFTRLGEAEAKVHGVEIRKVHFHEVGAVDSIADIVGTAIALDQLGVDRIECSPIPTGTGHIDIAHGRCSLPAPATAELLTGIPLAASTVEAELTTPTGAAIAAVLAAAIGPPPAMTIRRIGYGAGTRELAEQPNLLRVLLGEAADSAQGAIESETLALLETNLDDATGEIVGHTMGLLFAAGALDVYSTAIQMKKNRPGVLLSVLCAPLDVSRLEAILFRETGTLGVRRTNAVRSKLKRRTGTASTPWGPVEGVVAELPGGSIRFAPEYESCRRLAEKAQLPLRQVVDAAVRAFVDAGTARREN